MAPPLAGPATPFGVGSDSSAATDEPHQEQHDGNDQENPDEVPEGIAADHTQQPEGDQNDRDVFEHAYLLTKEPEEPAECRFLLYYNNTPFK